MTVTLIPLASWFCNSSLSTRDLVLPQTKTVHTWIFMIHCTGQVKVISMNRNSCVLAPVVVPAISYIGFSCDVELTTVDIFLSWGFRLTHLPCFEHYQFVCSHYSLVRAHITVSINYQEQQMKALSRTVCFTKCCELLLEETWSPNMHLTVLLQVELFSCFFCWKKLLFRRLWYQLSNWPMQLE